MTYALRTAVRTMARRITAGTAISSLLALSLVVSCCCGGTKTSCCDKTAPDTALTRGPEGTGTTACCTCTLCALEHVPNQPVTDGRTAPEHTPIPDVLTATLPASAAPGQTPRTHPTPAGFLPRPAASFLRTTVLLL